MLPRAPTQLPRGRGAIVIAWGSAPASSSGSAAASDPPPWSSTASTPASTAHVRRPALTASHRETARMLRRSGTDVARPLRPEACPSEHRRHRTDRTAGRSHIANGGDPRRREPAARWTRGCHRESVRRESVPVLDVRQQDDRADTDQDVRRRASGTSRSGTDLARRFQHHCDAGGGPRCPVGRAR